MKNSLFQYYKDFNQYSDFKLKYFIGINFLVGLLDGIGLAMFIPLLYLATNTESNQTLGSLEILVKFFQALNVPLNIFTTLSLMVFIFTTKGILSYLRSILMVKIQQISAKNIRLKLVHGLKDLSYEAFTKIDAGIVQNNMTTETNRLINATNLFLVSIQNFSMLIVYVILAIYVDWKFSILVIIGGLITNFLYKFLNTITIRHSKSLSHIGRHFQAYLIQSLHNFKYLKATNYYQTYSEKLQNEIILSEKTQFKIGKIAAISDNLREPLIILVISIVMLAQISFLGGEMDKMLAAMLLFYRSLNNLATFQGYWNKFLTNVVAKFSIDEMLDYFKLHIEKYPNGSLKEFGDIEVKNLTFKYGDKVILDKINLTLEKNTTLALVGESGAGKTTLANILCGLVVPKEGDIKINGNSLQEINVNAFRQRVGYVTQEPVIFDDTLYNNVTFWARKSKSNLDKFWKCIEVASLTSFVNNYSEKEDIPLGNNGILISGGQKQRISIARELFKDIDLMVFDEATSALDSETENFIQQQLDKLHGQISMVVVAHRLSTIKNADKILVMDKGKIIDSGNYNELLKSSPIFKRLVELQNLSYVNQI